MRARPGAPGDLDALCSHSAGVARESEGLELEAATLRRGVEAILRDPGRGRFFLLEDGGRVVASLFVTFEWSDWRATWHWWIQSAYVVPDRRGQGLFRRLYEDVRAQARREGVRLLRLYVEGHNEAGLRTYRGLGMRETPYRVFEQPP